MELLATSTDQSYTTEDVQQLRSECTDLQWGFAEAYVTQGGCGRRAAEAAGYKGTVNNFDRVACDNLHKPHVRRAIGYFIWQKGISIEHTLALLADVIRGARMDNFIDVDSEGRHRVNLKKAKDRGALQYIKKLKRTQYGLELELHDRMDAIKSLAGILQRAIIHRDEQERATRGVSEQLKGVGISQQTLTVLNLNL